jgi:hypothetical protein
MSRTWHKERESKYRGSKKFDSSCRNHGSCGWCQGNRHHKFERQAKQFHEDEFNSLTENLECTFDELPDSYFDDLDDNLDDYV